MTEYRQPLFGADGEACASCGAPLAADQRYCLACGTRRAEARLPFRDVLGAAEPPELVPLGAPIPSGYSVAPAAAAPTVNDRLRRNAPLMALVGILLVAMLIGVLLGHWSGQDVPIAAAAPARPQIIQVGGAAAAPAAAAATTPAETTPADTATPDDGAAKKDTSSSEGTSSGGAAKATNSAVKNLDKLSGKDYQKQIDKLGKTISTGGKAPPKDNKPPAGGGDFEDIG